MAGTRRKMMNLSNFNRLGKKSKATWRKFGFNPSHTTLVWNGFAELNKKLTTEQRKAHGQKTAETYHRLYGYGTSRRSQGRHKARGIVGNREAPGAWLARQVKR